MTRPPGPPRFPRRVLLPALIAALAPAVAACGGDSGGDDAVARERATGYRGVQLDRPLPKPDVVLTDTDGDAYDLREETAGTVTLLFFGYTNCPDVCPAQMANLGAVYGGLGPGVRNRVEVVFVTADPERDGPERIRQWLDGFHESFVGLRGPPGKVDSLQRSLGLQPGVPTDDDTGAAGAYAVDHGSAVLAFTPDDTARLAYPFGTRQRDWARDLRRLAEEGWAPR